MWGTRPFFAFCATFLFGIALGSPVCNTQLQLSLFLNDSYVANADLIRKGVPSKVVSAFYNDALKYLAGECYCSSTLLDDPCVNTKFNTNGEVAELRSLADMDEGITNDSRLFRLYDSQKILSALSSDKEGKLNYGLELLNNHINNLDIVNSPALQSIQFPSDDSFFQDESSAQTAACVSFNSITSNYSYPAAAATAYILGLIQEVRIRGGNLAVAHQFLQDHVSFVYAGVRCNKLSGDDLRVPIRFMKEFEANVSYLKVSDVVGIVRYSKNSFPSLVAQLSSLMSYGDSGTVLLMNQANLYPNTGPLVLREFVESILVADQGLQKGAPTASLSPPVLSFPLVPGPGGGGNTETETSEGTCPLGWIFVSRTVSVMRADEECCSDMCELLSLCLSDPFLWGIERENCCQSCNLFVCQDQTILPSVVPLLSAPPMQYPTPVDL
ncbi:unnamed protein product [Agarophyton chilense]